MIEQLWFDFWGETFGSLILSGGAAFVCGWVFHYAHTPSLKSKHNDN